MNPSPILPAKSLLRLILQPLLCPEHPNGVEIYRRNGVLCIAANQLNAGRIIGKQGSCIKAITIMMMMVDGEKVQVQELPDSKASSDCPDVDKSIQAITEHYLNAIAPGQWQHADGMGEHVVYSIPKNLWSQELDSAVNAWGWRAARSNDQRIKIRLIAK